MQQNSANAGAGDLRQLHAAAAVLHEALVARLGELLPPYADEVLLDLQQLTSEADHDLTAIRDMLGEAASVMEMLPSIPAEWEPVNRAALAAGLVTAS